VLHGTILDVLAKLFVSKKDFVLVDYLCIFVGKR